MGASRRSDWRVVAASQGDAASERAAQLARAREERRRQAEADAEQLLAEARRSAPDLMIPHTLRLLCRALGVNHVTLAVGPETRPQAVFYANPCGATAISWSDPLGDSEPPLSPPVDGAVSRLHAFVYGAGDPEPCGCLSLHSTLPRSFRAPEVALVDALAGLLARELELHHAAPVRGRRP
jgi:hypothetical protein